MMLFNQAEFFNPGGYNNNIKLILSPMSFTPHIPPSWELMKSVSNYHPQFPANTDICWVATMFQKLC